MILLAAGPLDSGNESFWFKHSNANRQQGRPGKEHYTYHALGSRDEDIANAAQHPGCDFYEFGNLRLGGNERR
tara:strand:+ start:330 stop:548 length:219 start_codon:yes stop_codon:yes gene_type:complete